jgi:hypothetical protein
MQDQRFRDLSKRFLGVQPSFRHVSFQDEGVGRGPAGIVF